MKHRYYRKWSWTKHCIWSTDDADSLGQELEAISAWCKGAHYNINIRAVYEVLNPNRLNPFYFCCWPQSTFLLCQKHLKIVFFAKIFLNVCIYKLTRIPKWWNLRVDNLLGASGRCGDARNFDLRNIFLEYCKTIFLCRFHKGWGCVVDCIDNWGTAKNKHFLEYSN